jgi:hypothetical protein
MATMNNVAPRLCPIAAICTLAMLVSYKGKVGIKPGSVISAIAPITPQNGNLFADPHPI